MLTSLPVRTNRRLVGLGLAVVLLLGTAGAARAEDYLATGTYQGDGVSGLAITDVGFAPDLVIIKGVNADHAFARTSNMPAGLSASLGDNKPLETNRILSFESGGFTVGTDHAVNEAGFPYYWVAMKTGTGHLALGQYTGNGSGYHVVEGSGFRPAAVVVISDDGKDAVLRTSAMTNGASVTLNDTGSLIGGILTGTGDGFAVGTSDFVNKAGITYYYAAWPAEADAIATGTYKGNGSGPRDLPVVGYRSEYLLVHGPGNQDGVHRMASVTGDSTLFFRNQSVRADVIRAVAADGFTVGIDPAVNDPGLDYTWLAFANPPAQIDLVLDLAADDPAPDVGTSVTFTATLRNAGPVTANGVQVKIPVPAGLTFVTDTPGLGTYDPGTGNWNVVSLFAGQQASLDLVCTVDAGTGGTGIVVSGVASAVSPDEANPSDNAASATVNIPAADLALTTLVSDPAPDVGSTVGFTATLVNRGPDPATGVSVSAPLPAGLVYRSDIPGQGSYDDASGIWTVGTVAPGGTTSLTIRADPGPGTGGTTLTVPFAVTALDQEDPDTGNDAGDAGVAVTLVDLGLTKGVDNAVPNVGDTVAFRLELTNAGPDAASGVAVRDLLPTGLTYVSAAPSAGAYDEPTGLWTIGTVGTGATVALDLVATVDAGTGGLTLTNNALVFAVDQEDQNPANDSAGAAVVVGSTDLQLAKTVDEPAPDEGATVIYTLAVTNTGSRDATAVAVVDSLPAGVTFAGAVGDGSYDAASGTWDVGAVGAGATAALDISASVDGGTAGTTIVNSARISASDLADPIAANDSDTASLTVAGTDLVLLMGADDAAPNVGEPVTVTATLRNDGPLDATGTAITLGIPAGLTYVSDLPEAGSFDPGTGTWTVGPLPATDELRLDVTFRVDTGYGSSDLVVTATATAAGPAEITPADNTAAVTLAIPAADLGLVALVDNSSPDVGTTVVFTTALTNNGPDEATGVAVSAVLPADLVYQSAVAGVGVYDELTGDWTVGTVGAGSTRTLTILAAPAPGSGGRTLSLPLAVTAADQEDLQPANDARSVSVTVTSADLQLTKTVDDPSPNEGDEVSFRIELTNAGPNRATGVEIRDLLPAGLDYVSAVPDAGSYDESTGLWTIGDLNSGATAGLDIVAGVLPGTAGQTLTNTAAVFSVDQEDPNPADNTASVAVTVNSTDLQLVKSVDDGAPNEGATVVFTIAVTNAGANTATGVAVVDSLPPGLTFVGSTASVGSYDPVSGGWNLGTVSGSATETLAITATVDAGTAGTTIVNEARISASDLADPVAANNRDQAAVTVASTDLQLTKTADAASPDEGAPVAFTLTLTNAGPNAAGGVVVNDLLPAGVTFGAATPSVGSYDPVSGDWTVGAVANGAAETLVIDVTVDAGTAGTTITNTAAIAAADLADPVPGNNSGTAVLTVSSTDLQVAKTVDDPTPTVGTTVVYTVTVTNAGPNVATGVGIEDVLPGGLSLVAATPGQGTYDAGSGLWSVGTLGVGITSTLTLTATVDASASGRNIVNTASVVAVDQADPDTANDSDDAAIDVPAVVVTPVVTARALAGSPATVLPGTADRTVLELELANRGVLADTLRSLVLTNLTVGADAPDQAALDAEWGPVTVYGQRRGLSGTDPETALPPAVFAGGSLAVGGFDWVIGPGDTLAVRVEASASVSARDGAVLQLGVTSIADIGVRQTVVAGGPLPLRGGHDLVVDGFVAAQAAVQNVPSGSVAVDTQRRLALVVDLPSNGYRPDALYGLTLVNRGNAGDGTDIAAMEAWSDDGDGVFDAASDTLLGHVVNSGELWQVTGLEAVIPTGGRRFFVTIDVAADALPGRTIRLELPVELGDAVIMASGNDGPRDLPLANTGVLAITVTDRLVLTTENIGAGTARPGARDVPLLTLNLANTYATERRLQSLTVTNGTTADAGASVTERDSILTQVVLRHDKNGNGVLDDFLADPALGSGSFTDSTVSYTGLDLPLAPDGLVRLFVTGEVSLDRAADGDILSAHIAGTTDVWAPGAALVAALPLDSDAARRVDGMVAAQVTTTPVPGRTLGPDDGPEPALDLVVPANGYLADRLVGVALVNEGTAIPADLARVRLWADEGDGVFDSDSDVALGDMGWLNGRWVSPVLSHTVPVGGARLFVSVDAATAPTDSATILFRVPTGGLVVASGNSGPIDAPLTPGGTLVLSTSALVARVDFDALATTVGRTGTVRLTVRNVGSESVSGITPALLAGDGPGTLTLGAPSPAIFDLPVDGSAEFTWTYTADFPGALTLVGSAAGDGDLTLLEHASAPTPSDLHRIYTAVPRLDAYPTTNLPATVPRGQADLVPLTLTLANPGDADVAVARLDSFEVRLAETATGPAIVPADLLDRIVVNEGSNVYVDETTLPASGDRVMLRLSPPAVITGSEPITLGLRLDLRAGSTAPSFLLAVDGSASFHATDAVSSLPVPVVLGGGTFPLLTRQADLVSPAGGLEATSAAGTSGFAQPGATDVPLATVALRNDAADPTASAIRVQAVGFVVRDIAGNPLPAASDLFDRMQVASPAQTLFDGVPQYADSLVVMLLATPLDVPVGASIDLAFSADLAATAPLGGLRWDFRDAGQWIAQDAADGAPVAITVLPDTPNAGLGIVAPVTDLVIAGAGLMPATVGRGARDIAALDLTLIHPGLPGTADAVWDSLVLRLRDDVRAPLDPSGLLDRVRVTAGGATIGLLVDPVAPGGQIGLGLAAVTLATGDTVAVRVEVDVRTDAPFASFELEVVPAGIHVRDAVSGASPALTTDGVWPVWSGLAAVVVPADELTVSGGSLMPPLLAAGDEPTPVLAVTLANPAGAGAGPVEVAGLVLHPAAVDNDFPAPGAAVALVSVHVDGAEVGRTTAVDPAANLLTVSFTTPVLVPAGGEVDLDVRLGIRPDAPRGRLRLALADSGISAGVPGSPAGGIRIVPAAGQTLPLETAIGNVGPASLADSYINFPNPFAAGREATTFAYWLRAPATVSLRLWTPHGESVATILDGISRTAGLHQQDTWTGANGRGLAVRNGVYIAELVVDYADGQRERVLRKVAVVR